MNGISYEDFIARKRRRHLAVGIDAQHPDRPWLMSFQRALVKTCLARGRAALFASTGLGKTRMQLAWADEVAAHTGGSVLVLAPLAVAQQTEAEATSLGLDGVVQCRTMPSGKLPRIVVTNYERLHHFDARDFVGVVLDESSCIKDFTARTTGQLTETFAQHRFRLCATATPAPNDFMELGTHAEFLGVCTRAQMLAEYFIHDGGDTAKWRIKGHARKPFWRWVASWALGVQSPTDIGFPEDGARYRLPPLNINEHVVQSSQAAIASLTGELFASGSLSLMQRREARRSSLSSRCALVALVIKSSWDGPGKVSGRAGQTQAGGAASRSPWLVWCELNSEQDELEDHFGDLAFSIRGSDDIDDKEERIKAWLRGERPVMISKPSILALGLNFQHCAQMAFVGLSDSFEGYYQAVRRCWRFGQKKPVEVHVVSSELEGAVVANIKRKGAMAEEMALELTEATREVLR